ncbi:RNA polymerase sigma factor [Bacillus coreaensis]
MITGLLEKAIQKDEVSEKIVFEMYYQRVYNTVYYYLHDRELTQDVVQETFLKAFMKLHTIDDFEKFGAWLVTIASCTAVDFLRKINRWNDIASEDIVIDEQYRKSTCNVSEVETIVEENHLRGLLLQKIDELSSEHKTVLTLKYLHDFRYEEIGESLKIKPGTVKTRIYRAKQRMRELLEQEIKDW